jgi:F0F1-type ATP synthase assembly protein I
MDKRNLVFRLIGTSFYIGVCIFLGVFGGLKLDQKFNTQPILILVGLILGLIVGFWGFYRMVVPIIKEYSEPKKNRKGDSK